MRRMCTFMVCCILGSGFYVLVRILCWHVRRTWTTVCDPARLPALFTWRGKKVNEPFISRSVGQSNSIAQCTSVDVDVVYFTCPWFQCNFVGTCPCRCDILHEFIALSQRREGKIRRWIGNVDKLTENTRESDSLAELIGSTATRRHWRDNVNKGSSGQILFIRTLCSTFIISA